MDINILKHYLGTGLIIRSPRHLVKFGHYEDMPLRGLSLTPNDNGWQYELHITTEDELYFTEIKNIEAKPICYRLSDLNKPISVEGYNEGKEFVPAKELERITSCKIKKYGSECCIQKYSYRCQITDFQGEFSKICSFEVVSLLTQWHFWIGNQTDFDKGLVIDKMKL